MDDHLMSLLPEVPPTGGFLAGLITTQLGRSFLD
jgi:hypothetical protein